MLDNIT